MRPLRAVPLLADRGQIGGRATAYVCRNYVCKLPVTETGGAGEQLEFLLTYGYGYAIMLLKGQHACWEGTQP